MITVTGLSLVFSGRKLFEDVNLKFVPGNCYGVIGANGAGKTTFTRILSGELEPTTGTVVIDKGKRLAILEQNHFKYDEFTVREAVIMGHHRLYQIITDKDALYAKENFTEEDGVLAGALEHEFAELGGWDAETAAEKLLQGLGVDSAFYDKPMSALDSGDKVKVLLAQALFGTPDILLLDEPTNHLDFHAVHWLEEFLIEYSNTVIVVSHDRHFLNRVCTHMVDIDYGRIALTVGNYDFWYESSLLAARMLADQNKKKEEKIRDLQAFIERFSSNASKARQATSRKKLLEKITIEDIRPSSRKYPYVGFSPEREAGKDILFVEGLNKIIGGEQLLHNVTFTMGHDDRVVVMSRNEQARTVLFQILMGEMEPDNGSFRWGVTTSQAYLPRDNSPFFDGSQLNLLDWMRQYSSEQTESFLRGYLGRMLFRGDDPFKPVSVLSGGERMRCMFSRMMLSSANVLLLDEPTNHLDLESITAVNDGLAAFKGNLLFASHDHKFIETLANRVIVLTPNGIYDNRIEFNEFLENEQIQKRIGEMYKD